MQQFLGMLMSRTPNASKVKIALSPGGQRGAETR